jgi:thymidylate synthase (FAD)
MNIELIASTPNPEYVIELAARTCYDSVDKMGLVTGSSLIPKLLASGHDSPLEHATATFRISGCSRAFTHQLVRHRLMSFSQKSQRYVKEDQFEYVMPDAIKYGSTELQNKFKDHMQQIQGMYNFWKANGLRNEDARTVLPNACATEIVTTANFRQFRTVFKVRCSRHAQQEIREACSIMKAELVKIAPNCFSDLVV